MTIAPRRILVCSTVIFLCGLGCRSEKAALPSKTAILPVPSWAEGAREIALNDRRTQLSFSAPDPYPSSRARDFYGSWADENNWVTVTSGVESWSADEWETFVDVDDTRIDQWTVHWRDQRSTKSLLLVLLYKDDRERQQVFVTLSPFFLLDEIDPHVADQ